MVVVLMQAALQTSLPSLGLGRFGAAQTPETGSATVSVIGAVIAIDHQTHIVTIKTDTGDNAVIQARDDTVCLRVPPGETTLAKAVVAQFIDIQVGDRILARGLRVEGEKQLRALRLIVLSKAEVEKKREHDLTEWRRRGLAGFVKEIDPISGEIVVEANSPEGPKRVLIITVGCKFRRYSSESIRFEEAKPSKVAEVKVGDQLKALGDKTADGKLKAEEIVFGTFRTIGAVVAEVDLQKGEIKANTLDQKLPITISLTKDSLIHRIPPEMAAVIARRVNGKQENAPQTQTPKAEAPDIQQMIDALPPIALANIKVGDLLAVTRSGEGSDAHIKAIKIVAGVDAVLNAIKPVPGKRRTITLTAGLPAVFDFSVLQQ